VSRLVGAEVGAAVLGEDLVPEDAPAVAAAHDSGGRHERQIAADPPRQKTAGHQRGRAATSASQVVIESHVNTRYATT
jgi:hypothetical protein